MNEWSGPLWNDCGACNWIRRSGVQHPRLMCSRCSGEAWLRILNLATNLTIAAGLQRIWDLGSLLVDDDEYPEASRWKPGCGRPAPGWGRR